MILEKTRRRWADLKVCFAALYVLALSLDTYNHCHAGKSSVSADSVAEAPRGLHRIHPVCTKLAKIGRKQAADTNYLHHRGAGFGMRMQILFNDKKSGAV